MKSVVLRVLGAGVIGVVGAGIVRSEPATAAAIHARAEVLPANAGVLDTRTVRLRIEGMTCGGCAISARVVLERLDGVTKAEVSYDEKIAVVVYDPKKVTPERMIETLKAKLKYTATVVGGKDVSPGG